MGTCAPAEVQVFFIPSLTSPFAMPFAMPYRNRLSSAGLFKLTNPEVKYGPKGSGSLKPLSW